MQQLRPRSAGKGASGSVLPGSGGVFWGIFWRGKKGVLVLELYFFGRSQNYNYTLHLVCYFVKNGIARDLQTLGNAW